MNFFPKKTKAEKTAFRVGAVLNQLTANDDFEFTDLETVQIFNTVKTKLISHLKDKRNEYIDKSIQAQEKADELKNIIDLIK